MRLRRGWKVLRNAARDLRYGALLAGTTRTKHTQAGAFDTANSDYDDLPFLFAAARVTPEDVIVDVGAGKGRAINWLLGHYPANQIYGIELDPEICARTARRLRRYDQVTILCGDATALLPARGTVFFLFNPFDEEVLRRFAAAVLALGGPRRIVYYNCKFLDVFLTDLRFTVTEIELPSRSHRSALIETAQSLSETELIRTAIDTRPSARPRPTLPVVESVGDPDLAERLDKMWPPTHR